MSSVSFLLVDDLEENLLSLEALLRRDNLVLLKAHSGDEALELLLQNDVALALIDVQMPGLNGFELAELMRGNERTRRIPIIFVTAGTADSQRRFRGYEAGAVDFIQKPIEPDVLRSKADVFFELYRQRQQLAAQRDELESQAEALKEAARRKDEFLVTLTHDITHHRHARARQEVLLREINHRIKNLFSVTAGLISLSAKASTNVEELAADLRSRLQALARAHDLTLPDPSNDTEDSKSANARYRTDKDNRGAARACASIAYCYQWFGCATLRKRADIACTATSRTHNERRKIRRAVLSKRAVNH